LQGGPRSFGPRFTGADLLRNAIGRPLGFDYGTVALCGARFHALRLPNGLLTPAGSATTRTGALQPRTSNAWPLALARFGLIPFRSPLLGESRLISFPRGTEMFHFPRLPAPRLCVQRGLAPHYQRWVSPFGNPRIKGYSTPHRGLSQSFTPFFGSRCQGIHHVPLLS
jgi:hypothetical protein